MTAFVILAAGRGGRAAQSGFLHKALLPLGGKAVISRQIELAPDSRVIIVTGYKSAQVKDYVELAHPHLPVTFVHVDDWDQPGSGPGKSLLAARSEVGDDNMIFTSCDTLWEENTELWKNLAFLDSWAAVATADSAGPGRWCRIGPEGVYDKSEPGEGDVYTGLAKIRDSDLPEFWKGIKDSALAEGECQVTGGLKNLFNRNCLETRRVKWTDTGTVASYEQAVAGQGYDWAKPGEVTYVLPEEKRVVKVRESVVNLELRHAQLRNSVAPLTGVRPGMLAYAYTEGVTGYEAAENDPDFMLRLLAWAKASLWHDAFPFTTSDACLKFYRDKTAARILMLRPELQDRAWPLLTSVDYDELSENCYPVTFHGDFNLGNIIVTYNRAGGPDGFTAIDWREDFAGAVNWGDRRYDIGKLIAGLYVHWGRARQGDFRPWPQGMDHLAKVKKWLSDKAPWDIMTIAALSLLSCAPLHAAPLDEILVNKAAEIMKEYHAAGCKVSLWIVNFRRLDALNRTITDWLASFPFEEVNVIANDPCTDYTVIEDHFPKVKIWRNIFRSSWETGAIAWCWNQCMRHTFETKRWCLMSQDDVTVLPGWDSRIEGDYVTYVAPAGDVVQLQSIEGFNAVGWFDERFRAIGGPEADYLLRMMQAYPDKLSAHDEHGWQMRHNDVGLANFWRSVEKTGEVGDTRAAFNVPFANSECFERWIQKWGEHVDTLFASGNYDRTRRTGWEEIDWYPSFTRRLKEMGRL